jgi:hypothetical protein
MTRQNTTLTPSRWKRLAFAAIGVFLGIAVPLGCAELALRLLPTNDGMLPEPVNAASPIFHFKPNRELTWSRGWDFRIVNRARVNNAGFVNDQIYDADDPRPLLAVVGDSYVEAVMIPSAATFHARLAAAAPARRLYTFAASGAPLSQYAAYARHARKVWRAEALVVVVIGNDFDESLAHYRTAAGFHHYVQTSDGSLKLARFDFQPGAVRTITEHSALARYLLFNIQAHEHVRGLLTFLPAFLRPARAEEYAGNTAALADRERIERSEDATRAFLRDVVSDAGWRPDQVMFVMDGARYPAGEAGLAGTYFGRMRSFFMEAARSRGFAVLDLDEAFFARYRAEPLRFELPDDGHWNAAAHAIVAEAIAGTEFFQRWQSSGTAGR